MATVLPIAFSIRHKLLQNVFNAAPASGSSETLFHCDCPLPVSGTAVQSRLPDFFIWSELFCAGFTHHVLRVNFWSLFAFRKASLQQKGNNLLAVFSSSLLDASETGLYMLNKFVLDGICQNRQLTESAFSSLDLVGQCMADDTRSEHFDQAIHNVVQSHHTVIDVGTGSGLLALFAARVGARQVIAIELDGYIAEVARANIRNNGYESVIQVIEADARSCRFEPGISFDVVIMEMLTTGMIDEFQIQAINNLHRQQVVNSSTVFIPCRQETYATLAYTEFEIYGLRMKMVRHIWEDFSDNQKVRCLSRPHLINLVDFSIPATEAVSWILEFEAEESGLINSIYLTGRTFLTQDISLANTLTLNAPVAIPIEERRVTKGERVTVSISYHFGGGFKNFISHYLPPPCKNLAGEDL
ncbi:MAG: 50S ribosomal protein L11 methyltransferase [Blastocatellia bacterium]